MLSYSDGGKGNTAHRRPTGRSGKGPTPFVFVNPDEFKYDTGVDIYDKYKMYIASKPWVKDNYLRIPDRDQNGFKR